MTSSVAPIEIAPLADLRIDDAVLTVSLTDGRVISTPLEWYPRLAYGTPQERANWRPIADGEGIHWPELDEDISVEGLIAGRKSGECGSSFKRWMRIQEQLRRMPRDFPALRREVLEAGPLTGAEIARRAREAIEAYDRRPDEWSIAISVDPFAMLRSRGFDDDSESVVYQSESTAAAQAARSDCVQLGMVDVSGPDHDAKDAIFVVLFGTAEANGVVE
jgi:hypothetical protein